MGLWVKAKGAMWGGRAVTRDGAAGWSRWEPTLEDLLNMDMLLMRREVTGEWPPAGKEHVSTS